MTYIQYKDIMSAPAMLNTKTALIRVYLNIACTLSDHHDVLLQELRTHFNSPQRNLQQVTTCIIHTCLPHCNAMQSYVIMVNEGLF